jgi:hypothetical protein
VSEGGARGVTPGDIFSDFFPAPFFWVGLLPQLQQASSSRRKRIGAVREFFSVAISFIGVIG